MLDAIENYIAVILAIIFIILLPAKLHTYETQISARMQEEYEASRIAWELERTRTADFALFKEDYDITCFTEYGVQQSYNTNPIMNTLIIPAEARYARVVYGNQIKWIVFRE